MSALRTRTEIVTQSTLWSLQAFISQTEHEGWAVRLLEILLRIDGSYDAVIVLEREA